MTEGTSRGAACTRRWCRELRLGAWVWAQGAFSFRLCVWGGPLPARRRPRRSAMGRRGAPTGLKKRALADAFFKEGHVAGRAELLQVAVDDRTLAIYKLSTASSIGARTRRRLRSAGAGRRTAVCACTSAGYALANGNSRTTQPPRSRPCSTSGRSTTASFRGPAAL